MGIRMSEYEKLLENLGKSRPKPKPERENGATFAVADRPETNISIPLQAIPKARPRFGKNGSVYCPSAQEEKEMASLIASSCGEKIDQDCAVTIYLHKDHTEISILPISGRRKHKGDIDNIAKFVLDALVKSGVLEDDRLIKSLTVEIL